MDSDAKQFQIFTKDGRKFADGIGRVDCLKPCEESPKKIAWDKLCNFRAEFEIKLTDEDRERMKAITDMIYEDTQRRLPEFYEEVNKKFEYILRNYVTPPIKGEITKGKVRWRGLQVVWQKTDTLNAFVGVRQRDWLIFPNGKKIAWDSLVDIDKE